MKKLLLIDDSNESNEVEKNFENQYKGKRTLVIKAKAFETKVFDKLPEAVLIVEVENLYRTTEAVRKLSNKLPQLELLVVSNSKLSDLSASDRQFYEIYDATGNKF